jgi:hypothetical protein
MNLLALPGWLGVGAFLAWLVHDFSRISGLGQENLAALLILTLFVISALVIAMISWSTYRNSIGRMRL